MLVCKRKQRHVFYILHLQIFVNVTYLFLKSMSILGKTRKLKFGTPFHIKYLGRYRFPTSDEPVVNEKNETTVCCLWSKVFNHRSCRLLEATTLTKWPLPNAFHTATHMVLWVWRHQCSHENDFTAEMEYVAILTYFKP